MAGEFTRRQKAGGGRSQPPEYARSDKTGLNRFGEVPQITVQDLHRELDTLQLIDVRQPGEWEQGHVARALSKPPTSTPPLPIPMAAGSCAMRPAGPRAC